MQINIKILGVVILLLAGGCASQGKKEAFVETTTEKAELQTDALTQKSLIKSVSVQNRNDVLVLDHKIFKIFYDQGFHIAKYVKYTLEAKNLGGPAKRRDKFIPDPLLIERGIKPIKKEDYTNSGYDRGHLAPSEDFTWDQKVNDLTFIMSNMTPQKPKLNQDAWKRLEMQVRKWACGEERVLITSGPILEAGLPRLRAGVAIPRQFFKVIIDDTPPRKALAFVYNQDDAGDVLMKRMVGFVDLEKKIQMSFESEVPKADAAIFSKQAALSEWKVKDCSKKAKRKIK